MVMRLTRELIHQAGTRKGSGWNKAQLLLLGVPWPPRYGWLRRLEGKEINDLVWTKVLELRGAKPKESRFQEQKLLEGIITTMITTQDEHQELAHLRAEVHRLQAEGSKAIAALAECIGERDTALNNAKGLGQALEAAGNERDRLRKIVEDFETLVGESSGVYGLHLNGDPSPWSEILVGGRFERIGDIEAALKGGGQ